MVDVADNVELYDPVAVELGVSLVVTEGVPVLDGVPVTELDMVAVEVPDPVPLLDGVAVTLGETVPVSVDVEEAVLDTVGKLVDDWLPLGVDVLVDEELVVASLVLVEVIVCVPDDVILEVAV